MTEELNSRIAQRAYELFLQRGGQHGSDQDDWTQAEKDVLAAEAKAKKAVEPPKPAPVSRAAAPAAAKPVAAPAASAERSNLKKSR